MDGIKIRGAAHHAVAARGDDLPHELIPRRVFGHLAAQPIVISLESVGAKFFAANQKQIGPTIRPVINELRPREELIDELVALVFDGAGEEGFGLGGRGQRADHIKMRAPGELAVRARRRGFEVELAQLREHELVDEIAPWCLVKNGVGNGVRPRRCDARDGNLAGVPRGDGALPKADDLRLAGFFIDDRHGRIGGIEPRPRRHIAPRSIAEMRGDLQLPRVAFLQFGIVGRKLHALQLRIRIRRPGRALLDPFHEQLIIRRILVQHFAALVPHGGGGFNEQQTARRIAELHAPPAHLARDVVMITRRIVRIEAQAKAAFARQRPVATAAIATHFGNHRQHIVPKTDWPISRRNREGREGRAKQTQ